MTQQTIIVVKFGTWNDGIAGGIVRTQEGDMLIRVSDSHRNTGMVGAIATELIARCLKLIHSSPAYKLLPCHVLLPESELAELEQNQLDGLGKLTTLNVDDREGVKVTSYRMGG